MTQQPEASTGRDWIEASGLLHIFRTLGLAVQPAKLGIGLTAIIVTFLFGWLLDAVWMTHGGVARDAISQFILARHLDAPYEEPAGEYGIFHVWRDHQRRCILGLLGSSIPGASVAAGTTIGSYMETHSTAQPLENLAGMVYGVWWMVASHPLYSLVFGAGLLLLWSYAGGAICRLAAVQFARDEKQTAGTALRYARDKLVGGFLMAPCIPLILMGVTALALVLGGMVLRIPILGDLIGALAFPLALVGGFILAMLVVGVFVGGSLFWPCVAVEGSDAFDAFSRGLSYPFSKPWKWILYVILTVVYAAVCWLFVNLFTFLMLKLTRVFVSFGTSPFGWWPRGDAEHPVSKLALLWPLGGPNNLYRPPDWSQLAWYEDFSAVLIGCFVLLVIGLMWSFLASFYFSGSTVIYCLLRRDVDGTDLEEVHLDEEESESTDEAPSDAADTQENRPDRNDAGKVSLPVVESPPHAQDN
ncbi:MAG: hypothetical protein D6788_06125 [Planctomycetota bacterium]|nr:MAG: hypothetical protein D6788_06125 [Planctomycetota bacterium]